jgi:acetyl/propionyl-CoA carboxylase alpha subunit
VEVAPLPKVPEKVRKESLERLRNRLEQAKVDGNRDLIRFLQAIVDRIEGRRR